MTADIPNSPPDDNSISLAAAQQIDATCDAFEAQWRRGERPQIEGFFRADATDSSALFRELLRIEVEYRQKTGERPRRGEYLSRFRELASVVVEVLPADPAATSVGDRTHWSDSTSDGLSKLAAGDTSITRLDLHPRLPHATAPTVGSSFGPYDLIAELGRGGMGVVYRARHRQLNRVVALKIIDPARVAFDQAGHRDGAVARFRHEAETTARFEHAHIVPIYDVGSVGGLHYYAMRYVEGASLAQLADERPLDPKRAARYVASAAHAADEVHRAGFLHRDLKPGNILVDRSTDTAYVADFGLAKFVEAGQGDTLTGDVFGTPPYMSPEQTVDSGKVTAASDIYSLGATLYHLLTGRPPFQAATPVETARQVLECEVVPPRRVNPAIDPELEAICLKSLEKEPHARYATAAALSEDLKAWLERRPIVARRATPARRLVKLIRRHRRAVVGAVGATLALLLLATFATVLVKRAQHRERVALSENRLRESKQLLEKGHRELEAGDVSLALSDFVAAMAVDRDNPARTAAHLTRLSVTAAAAPRLQQIIFCDAPVVHTGIDPTGRYLVGCDSAGHVQVWDWKHRKPLYEKSIEGSITAAGFAPDGERFFVASEGRVFVFASSSGGQLDVSDSGAAVGCAVFDPTGATLALGRADGQVCVRDLALAKSGVTLEHGDAVKSIAFSPDGRLLATASLDGFARVWRMETAECVLPPFDCDGSVNTVAISPKGNLLAVGGLDGKLRLWELTAEAPRLTATCDHGATISQIKFAPNGSRIVSVGEHGFANLWDVATGHLVAALRHEGQTTFAEFSVDGTKLITGSHDRRARIWDPTTGEPLAPPLWHAGVVTTGCFDSESQDVVTGSTDEAIGVGPSAI